MRKGWIQGLLQEIELAKLSKGLKVQGDREEDSIITVQLNFVV